MRGDDVHSHRPDRVDGIAVLKTALNGFRADPRFMTAHRPLRQISSFPPKFVPFLFVGSVEKCYLCGNLIL